MSWTSSGMKPAANAPTSPPRLSDIAAVGDDNVDFLCMTRRNRIRAVQAAVTPHKSSARACRQLCSGGACEGIEQAAGLPTTDARPQRDDFASCARRPPACERPSWRAEVSAPVRAVEAR